MGAMHSESKVVGLIASLARSSSAQSIFETMVSAATELGFDTVHFSIRLDLPGFKEPLRHELSGYPDEFQRIYEEHEFLSVDPTVLHCMSSTAPLVWTDDIYCVESRLLKRMARRFGLNHGISIPVHDSSSKAISMINLARDQRIDSSAELNFLIEHGILLANMLHAAVKSLVVPDVLRQAVPALTKREQECLRWLAMGKSNGVIGNILNISEAAVNFHTANLFKKMNVTTRAQAAALGLSLGFVSDIGCVLKSRKH